MRGEQYIKTFGEPQHEKKERVIGGTMFLYRSTVIAIWDNCGSRNPKETWTLPDNGWGRAEAERNFDDMVEQYNEQD